jgi:hypothetical protein
MGQAQGKGLSKEATSKSGVNRVTGQGALSGIIAAHLHV